MKSYNDVDKSVLKTIKNPSKWKYTNIHNVPEITFLGSEEKPDFAELSITIVYRNDLIELKSLKEYFFQWRDVHVSNERFICVVYEHIMSVYNPSLLELKIITKPRGGISTTIML